MQIYVNNRLAALKKGTSFEYVSENRMFSGSDGYTLTITFPLRGCPQNLAIFGHINRADVVAQKVIFDCEIRDRNFYKFGSITITEISEVEVKTQFLEGRSEQNFDKTFDKVYINELDLGQPPYTSTTIFGPDDAWNPVHHDMECVALPWVNDYSGNIQNLADFVVVDEGHGEGYYVWNKEKCTGLSWQPYLLYITRKICEAVGYTADFSQWEDKEEYKYLLICNTLPYAWDMPEFARALPHWTVEEYFEKLQLFLDGEFDFDHRAKRISFAFTQTVIASKPVVSLNDIVEEHSTEVSIGEERCDYREAKNLVYKECDHEMWKFYSCEWFINGWQGKFARYHTMQELLLDNATYRVWDGQRNRGGTSQIDRLLYAEDVDMYFIIRAVDRTIKEIIKRGNTTKIIFDYRCVLQPLNLFGGRIVNDADDAEQVEVEFVPAWIDETEAKYGKVLFLSFASYDEDNSSEGENEEDYPFMQTIGASTLKAGEKEKKAEYYDRIYIGYWDDTMVTRGKLPRPWVDNIEIWHDWASYDMLPFSFRLNDRAANSKRNIPRIDPKMKMSFKFLSDSIPDVRSIFLIRGKRYVCEKMTATFTAETGMSQLIKGSFYPIAESET